MAPREPGKEIGVKGIAAAALAGLAIAVAAGSSALAQTPTQCFKFPQLRDDAQQKALSVRNAMSHHVERKEICALMTRFYAAEATVVKFLEENKTWCGIPEQAVTVAKTNHERTLKFRTAACTEAPAAKARAPSLSDAIGTPTVDTSANTKTGHGTLDSLNGNPLAK
ncbi:MAG TPA: hypothetical protein VMV19_12250 [Xanthobacteraceae bacterium]|nr:hypothetical protein [Xanthobacteraceae bacterium]